MKILSTLIVACLSASLLCGIAVAQEDDVKNETKFVGKWVVDLERTESYHDEKGTELPDDFLDEIDGVSIEFTDSENVTLKAGVGFEMEVQWVAEPDEDDENKFELKLMGEGAPDRTAQVTFLDSKTIVLKPGTEPAAVMVMDTSGAEPAERLVGVWVGDADSTAEIMKKDGVDEQEIEIVSEMVAGLKLTFQDDDSYTVELSGEKFEEGTWEVTEVNDDGTFKMVSTANTDETKDFMVEFLENDMVKFQQGENPPAICKREM